MPTISMKRNPTTGGAINFRVRPRFRRAVVPTKATENTELIGDLLFYVQAEAVFDGPRCSSGDDILSGISIRPHAGFIHKTQDTYRAPFCVAVLPFKRVGPVRCEMP